MFLFLLLLLYAVARFDFSWCDPEYHQETLENLKTAIKGTKKLCAVSFIPSLQSCRIIEDIAWPNFNKPILLCNMRFSMKVFSNS
jgi:hypothetical protein